MQAVCALYGISLEVADLQTRLLDIVNVLFAVLASLGIVADPTTAFLQDSDRAMSYEAPWVDADAETAEEQKQ